MGITLAEAISRLRDYGLAPHPTREDAWVVNLDIAVAEYGLEDNEACKAAVYQALKEIADEWKMKLYVVKADEQGADNET